jgi:hypothetical protein
MTANTNLQPPKVSPLWVILALAVFILMLSVLESCNSAARLERKELEPYKKINSDVSGLFNDKKLELGANYCNDHFPIQVKEIVRDSVVKVLVSDTNSLKELRKLKDLLKKGCPTLNIDSLLIQNMIIDTVYLERYHTKTVTEKDTIGNYRVAKELYDTKQALLINQSNLTTATDKITLLEANEKNGGYLLKLLFFKYWWIILLAGIGVGVFGYWKLKGQYLSKIVK